MKRINCSHYTDLDDLVINKASESGLPLIGGTALEVWSNYLGAKGVRKRSDNDLDFVASSIGDFAEFRQWLLDNIDPDKVKVDMYLSESDFERYIKEVDGIKIMSIPYLIWSKIKRPDRSEKDIQDLKWMLSIPDVSDEDIEEVFNDLGCSPKEAYDLYKLIGYTDDVASEMSDYYPEN